MSGLLGSISAFDRDLLCSLGQVTLLLYASSSLCTEWEYSSTSVKDYEVCGGKAARC